MPLRCVSTIISTAIAPMQMYTAGQHAETMGNRKGKYHVTGYFVRSKMEYDTGHRDHPPFSLGMGPDV